jgi:ubiquinone/menaquinone biosynthesis C-methylase UbiE
MGPVPMGFQNLTAGILIVCNASRLYRRNAYWRVPNRVETSMGEQTSESELRNTWESAAPGWAKWEAAFSSGLADVTDTMISMAGIGAGSRVLDLACGAGAQTIQAAKRVGANGIVVASDISGTMLENIRRRAEREGIANIETLECAAEDLSASLTPFDAAMCRLGLMLFPSPSQALAAIQRVLKPGGRFAALVFSTPASNPFASQPMQILLRHAGKQPPIAGQPGIFALGADGALNNLLEDCGFVDVRTVIAQAPLRLPNPDVAPEMMQQAFGAYRAVVADLSESKRSAAWTEVRKCLAQFKVGGRFETEFEFVIGSGAKRAQ